MAASITANVATYSANSIFQNSQIPTNWAIGNSITVTNFGGGDAFFNQTCTLTAVTTTSVSCALIHGNATAGNSNGIVTNISVGPFVTADVGKQVAGWQNCEAFVTNTVMGANAITASGAPLITSFVSSTQVQITTAANAQVGQTGCFIWGHPDDAAAQVAETAYVQYPFCARLILSASNYMYTKPHFYTNPAACAVQGVAYPNTAGNVYYGAGFELEGRGPGATNLFVMPNFPNGDACNRGQLGDVCWYIPLMGKWRDLQITGGSNPTGFGLSGPRAFMGGQVITVDNITCTNAGAYESGFFWKGFEAGFQVQFIQYNNSGCGGQGLVIIPSQGVVTAMRMRIENNLVSNLNIGQFTSPTTYSLDCYDCAFYNSQNANIGISGDVIINQGGKLLLYGSQVGNGSSPVNGQIGYACLTNNGCVLVAHDTSFSFTAGGTGNSSIVCTTNCTNYLENTILTSSAGGNSYKDSAGSILYDLGGNTITQSTVNISGKVFGSPSITGTSLVNGNVVLSSCGTSAVSAASGSSQAGQFTITFAGTPGTACTWTLTYPAPFLVAPQCAFFDVGGTNAFPTSIVNGSVTSTSAAATENGTTLTNGNTEIVQYRCSVP